MKTVNLKNFIEVINNKIIKVIRNGDRYEFLKGDQVLHSLDIGSTNKDRLVAHWEGFISNLSPLCDAARVAIYAAKNIPNWGRDAALHYAVKRGVLPLYRLACQLEAVK